MCMRAWFLFLFCAAASLLLSGCLDPQAAIDSIAKLPATAQKAAAAYKTGLDSLVKELENAKAAMHNWMDGFNMDSAMNDEQKRTEYLEAEKTKIHSVKDQMLKTLDKADSLLRH